MQTNNNQTKDTDMQRIPISNGIGLFTGPISENLGITRSAATKVIVIAVPTALAMIPGMFILGPEFGLTLLHYACISSLFVILPLFIAYNVFKISRKIGQPVKTMEANGIWITRDSISWGKKIIEFEKEHSLTEVYSPGSEPVHLVSEMSLPQEGASRVDTSRSTITFQIAHSRKNSRLYRVVFVHLSEDGKNVYSHNFVHTSPPILIADTKLTLLNNLKLVDQLRKFADVLKSFRDTESSICNLLITPRTQISKGLAVAISGVISGDMTKALAFEGSEFQSAVDSKAKGRFLAELAEGKFIDSETGSFLLELAQQYNWKIGYRILGDNELGPFDDSWFDSIDTSPSK